MLADHRLHDLPLAGLDLADPALAHAHPGRNLRLAE